MLRLSLLALLLLGTGACGFRPLYSAQGQSAILPQMQDIAIGGIEGPREAAYFLRQSLRDSLPGSGDGQRYTLSVELEDQRRASAVRRTANTTRFNYYLNGRYTLTDRETGEVRRQNVQAISSYGVVTSQYASLVGREDAVRRAAVDLGQQIEFDIALYLKGRAPAEDDAPLPPVINEDLLDRPTPPAPEGSEDP